MIDAMVSEQLVELEAIHGAAFVVEIIDLFNEDAPLFFEALQQAQLAGDSRGIERAVHALRGSCLNFNAAQLAEQCRVIEHLARANSKVEAAQVAALEVELGLTMHWLTEARANYLPRSASVA